MATSRIWELEKQVRSLRQEIKDLRQGFVDATMDFDEGCDDQKIRFLKEAGLGDLVVGHKGLAIVVFLSGGDLENLEVMASRRDIEDALLALDGVDKCYVADQEIIEHDEDYYPSVRYDKDALYGNKS